MYLFMEWKSRNFLKAKEQIMQPVKCCACVFKGNRNKQETRKSDWWGKDNLSVQGSPSVLDLGELNLQSGEGRELIEDKAWKQWKLNFGHELQGVL